MESLKQETSCGLVNSVCICLFVADPTTFSQCPLVSVTADERRCLFVAKVLVAARLGVSVRLLIKGIRLWRRTGTGTGRLPDMSCTCIKKAIKQTMGFLMLPNGRDVMMSSTQAHQYITTYSYTVRTGVRTGTVRIEATKTAEPTNERYVRYRTYGTSTYTSDLARTSCASCSQG